MEWEQEESEGGSAISDGDAGVYGVGVGLLVDDGVRLRGGDIARTRSNTSFEDKEEKEWWSRSSGLGVRS